MIPQARLTWAVTRLSPPFSDDYMLSSWQLKLSSTLIFSPFNVLRKALCYMWVSCYIYMSYAQLICASVTLFCLGFNVYCCEPRCLCWVVLGPWTYQTSWRPRSPNWTVQFCERSLSYCKRYSGQPNVGDAESKGSAWVLMVCVPHGLGGWVLMCPGMGYLRIPK